MNFRGGGSSLVLRVATVLLVCWWPPSLVQACPQECSCKWRSGKITAECADRGLITVPSKIGNDTQVLDLSGNDIQILRRDVFAAEGISLQKLYVRSCRLGEIDKYAFRNLTNLVEVDLSDNLLTHVPSQAFDDVPYLRNISLAHNPIHKVEAFAFKLVPQLQRLDLAHCHLQSIRPKAFDNLNVLEYLKLNDNELHELPTDTLESLPRLKSVELHANSWICDCHLRAVKVYLHERAVSVPSHKILCAGGPERLRNLSIMDLDADDFACKPSVKTDMRYVEATVGSNITLECRVESDPVATITWFSGNKMITNDSGIVEHDYGQLQRMYIVESENDVFDKRSKLVLARLEDGDAGEYHCVAENRAGHDEANFTLYAVSPAGLPIIVGTNINVITIALGFLIIFMLVVIVLLLKRIRYGSYADDDDGSSGDVNVKKHHPEKSNSIDTSSQKSHDSEIKSESGKAFTVTSDLSYSRSLSDIGNPTFSNPDLINGAPNARDSACATPITRPISDYCHNWQKSYALPPSAAASRAVSSTGFASYDHLLLQHQHLQLQQQQQQHHHHFQHPYHQERERGTIMVDTMSAGSGSDDVFTHSRMSNDYPPDYGLPILPEHEVASQPCAKTLKVWQRGVPVFPPMPAPVATSPVGGPPPPPNFQTLPLPPHVRQSPADRRYQRCGTDV